MLLHVERVDVGREVGTGEIEALVWLSLKERAHEGLGLQTDYLPLCGEVLNKQEREWYEKERENGEEIWW